jgi:hypothetical protein
MQASTSMLEAKGEGIMSWFEDDNFILDDDLAPDFEVQICYCAYVLYHLCEMYLYYELS